MTGELDPAAGRATPGTGSVRMIRFVKRLRC